MVKYILSMPLSCPHYSCISKQAKTINVTFKTKNKGSIQNLAIGSTGLTVYGKVLLNLLKTTRRKINEISADDAYDTK
ncbi:Mobile element protein [Candidatus Enterovibrio altilux]|uniref:Mobile element protein n=1 Tax=Candidatus Enterovibrio altilux TaxID=1927128 RepID=A0A291BBY6_9GAMM|nr:Mobile element protein [Candidatus Enterovibrio luxaltus]